MAQFIFEFTEKMILAFEWDLRDIDGATHFHGFATQLFFFRYVFVKVC